MKKFTIALLCLLLCLHLVPGKAYAAEPLDVSRNCSLTLTYAKDGKGFSDLEIKLYRVAQANADGSFDLIEPYSSFPVNIHGITSQKEWKDTASTLLAYIASQGVTADKTQKTQADGKLTVADLKTGLYLIEDVTVENDTGTYLFDSFMVYLPTPVDGSYDYDREAVPKCSSFTAKNAYQVTKLWKDTGFTSSRPKSIAVEIRKDGKLQETVTLNSDNNWTHTWHTLADDPGKWTVTEKDVPDSYQVTVSENKGVFTITNTRQSTSVNPPKTGDTFALGPWTMVMCLSGSLLLILSIYGRRRK